MRGTIARRMHASLHEMAQLTLGTEVSADAVVRLRDELKDAWAIDGKSVPTYTDLVARAAAIALRAHPLLNARIVDDAIEVLPDIHIGIAIALDGGLVVPAVRHADRIDLAQFAADSSELVERARANRLTMHDLEGATFSVTALGSYGIDFFTPVINPPNVAILGVGRIRDTVVWAGERQNEPRRAQLITLSLTFDHRAVDGAPAAAFLGTVGELLERPLRLL
jgi:pyruvate/2-oxoglutarate dehydrogenase complex dihydrolipoamide acyltransferase (E2) component